MLGAASITPAGSLPDRCGSPKPDSRFRPGSSPRSVFVSDDTIRTVYAYRWSLVNGRRLPVSDWFLTLVSECLEQSQTATTHPKEEPPMIRTTHVARLALIGVVAAAVAAPGAQAATKVVHADDRADRAAPAGMRAGPPAPVTPDNRAERAAPAGLRVAGPAPVTPTTAPTGPAHRSRRPDRPRHRKRVLLDRRRHRRRGHARPRSVRHRHRRCLPKAQPEHVPSVDAGRCAADLDQ